MIKVANRSLNISIPERTVGYSGDNLVETRTFELNRLYGDVDLAEFDFKLDTQVGDIKNIIDLEKTVTEDKVVLTWVIAESHVLYAGIMSIQLRAFKGEVEKWHSAQGYVQVQPSINAAQTIPDPLPSEFEQMEQRITEMRNEVMEAAAIVEEAEEEVLQPLIEAIEDAGQAKGLLDDSIEDAGTAKTQLDGSISDAGTAKTGLEGSISNAGTVKEQLDGSISSAGTAKDELDGSISTAGEAKSALDESIQTGDLAAFKGEFQSHLNDYATLKTTVNKYDSFVTVQNPPELMSVPAISDTYNFDTKILTHNTAKLELSGFSYAGLNTGYMYADYVYTSVLPGAKPGTALIDGMTVYKDKNGTPLIETAGGDHSGVLGKYSYQSTGRLWIFIPKGTYANIESAREGLGTTEVIYQLATPTTQSLETYGYELDLTDYSNFAIDIETAAEKEIKIINVPTTANKIISATLKMKYTAGAVLRFPSVAWRNGVAPNFIVGKTYLILLVSYNNGLSWLGSLGGEF